MAKLFAFALVRVHCSMFHQGGVRTGGADACAAVKAELDGGMLRLARVLMPARICADASDSDRRPPVR